MRKLQWISLVVCAILFALLVIFEYNKPKPVNWSFSLSGHAKIPYGCDVLKNCLPDAFPGKNIIENNDGLYLFRKNYPGPVAGMSLIFITYNFSPDKYEIENLLSLADAGFDVFIAAGTFGPDLLDTLKIDLAFDTDNPIPSLDQKQYSHINFVNPALKKSGGYKINSAFIGYYFSLFDTAATTVLGADSMNRVNFIRIDHGAGKIYLNTYPLAFSNYNLLNGGGDYAFGALSYLNGNTLAWDEFFKPFKPTVSSPLRFVLSQPPLKAAYVLLLVGLVLYIIFKARRRQRVLPVIKPPVNTSLEFATTIGRLYFNNGNHKDLAFKKFTFFCEYLRNRYYIRTIATGEDFYKKLSEKSGVEVAVIEYIFRKADYFKTQNVVGEWELLGFSARIDEFYRKAG